MKILRFHIILFFLLLGNPGWAQKFILSNTTNNFGSAMRIVPSGGNGFVVFSKDSLRLTAFNNCGETLWSRQLNVPNAHNSLSDFIATRNGTYTLLTRFDNGSVFCSLVTRIDASGNVIWSKSFEDSQYNQFPYTISEDTQGNLFVYSNVEHVNNSPVYNMLIKTDSNGNQLWTRFYNHGGIWGGAITTSDNGVLLRTGSIFIKTDPSGNEQWSASFGGGTYNYFAPVEVADGYIFTGYNTLGQDICFMKMDKFGNSMWNGKYQTNFIGSPPFLKKLNNGNFACIFNKSNYSTAVEFNKDLNIVQQGSFSLSSQGTTFTGTDIIYSSNGTPLVIGITNTGLMGIVAFDSDYVTSCTFNPPDLTKNLIPFMQFPITTNVISNPMNVVNRIYNADTTLTVMNTFCFVPKILDLGNDTVLCHNTTLQLKNITGDVFDHYEWSTGDTTASIIIHQPGTYWLIVKDECELNKQNDTVWVTVLPSVIPDLGPDRFLCNDEAIVLTVPECNSCTFAWSNGSTNEQITVTNEGVYWLAVDNQNGCINRDTLVIDEVKCECNLYVPNAFTPNGDGKNETFHPVYDCELASFSMQIFNRWGQLIYESSDATSKWKGNYNNKQMPEGLYVYVIEYVPMIKGTRQATITKTGTISMIY